MPCQKSHKLKDFVMGLLGERKAGKTGASVQHFHFQQGMIFLQYFNPVLQRASHPFPVDFHHVVLLQENVLPETQTIGSEEVDVGISGAAMLGILEMMVLQIFDAVTHVGIPRFDRLGPDDFSLTFDGNLALDVIQPLSNDQFRSQGALPEFGMGQVEVIHFFHHVIGKFVAGC